MSDNMGAERLERLGALVALLEAGEQGDSTNLDEVRAEIRELIRGFDGTLAQGLRDRINDADPLALGDDQAD